MNNLIFVSPHMKTIGESYILPKFIELNRLNQSGFTFFLFNCAGEWDAISTQEYVINNPLRALVKLHPNIERLSPWLNYRIWLALVSLTIIFGLPLALKDVRLGGAKGRTLVIARMATSSVALSKMLCRCPVNVKFVVSMAGVPLVNFYRKYFLKFVYRQYESLILPVSSMSEHLAKLTLLNPSDFRVVENPVLEKRSQKTFADNFQERQFEKSFVSSALKIVVVGRLTKQKGIDVLLTALSRVNFNWRLFVIGEGEERLKLESLVLSLGIRDRVSFLGFVNNPFSDAPKFDLFVMPSLWEGPGHTIIEALASAIPSIATDCPYGPAETSGFGRYALVCKSGDADDLALKLVDAATNYVQFADMLKSFDKELDKYLVYNISKKWHQVFETVFR